MVERLEQEYDVDVRWMPFELRPGLPEEGEPLPASIRARIDAPDNPLRKMAGAQGLPIVFRTMLYPSRLAHEATEFARTRGRGAPFHHAVMARYWGGHAEISDQGMLCDVAAEVGLDTGEMAAALDGRTYRPDVDALLREARRLGVSGVPFHVVDDQVGISGAQPYEVFERVMRELGVPKRPGKNG